MLKNLSKNLVNFSITVSLFLVLSPVLENLETGGKTLVNAVPVVAIFLLLLCLMPTVLAIDFDEELSDEDQETFDGILEPVMKIYNFIKYAATVLAVLFLVFAGIIFVTSGNDQAKREQAKSMALYVVIGLVIIWIAPLVVGFLVG
jgi:hypothetical protein